MTVAEGRGHPSRVLPGMLEHLRVSLIIASCIVRAVPFGVHDGEENGSFVHFCASVTYIPRPVQDVTTVISRYFPMNILRLRLRATGLQSRLIIDCLLISNLLIFLESLSACSPCLVDCKLS